MTQATSFAEQRYSYISLMSRYM